MHTAAGVEGQIDAGTSQRGEVQGWAWAVAQAVIRPVGVQVHKDFAGHPATAFQNSSVIRTLIEAPRSVLLVDPGGVARQRHR